MLRGIALVHHVAKGHVGSGKDQICVVKNLKTMRIDAIVKAKGILCEMGGGEFDHISTVCRILGIPIIVLENACTLIMPGTFISLNGQTGEVFLGNKNFSDDEVCFSVSEKKTLLDKKFQICVVSHRNIDSINESQKYNNVSTFFLRHEFFWYFLGKSPYDYVKENGIVNTSIKIRNHIKKFVIKLNNDQLLNFRSVDIRSNEFNNIEIFEENPHLGLHGLRRSLKDKDLLISELLAVDYFYKKGYNNVLFSLPYVTDESEVKEVVELVFRYCKHPIRLGVFIETPSAVNAIERILSIPLVTQVTIGTKDLTQLLLGCDRNNPKTRHIFSMKHRCVIETINETINKSNLKSVVPYVYSSVNEIDAYTNSLANNFCFSLCLADFLLLMRSINP